MIGWVHVLLVNGNYSSKPVAPISQPAAKIEQDTITAGGVLSCSRRTRLTYRGLYMLITSIIYSTADDGIMNKTVKLKQSKAMDMRFYWLQDRVEQGQFRVYWSPGKYNLADYFSKLHSPSHYHHRKMRTIYFSIK